jgi:hypothetical protein
MAAEAGAAEPSASNTANAVAPMNRVERATCSAINLMPVNTTQFFDPDISVASSNFFATNERGSAVAAMSFE